MKTGKSLIELAQEVERQASARKDLVAPSAKLTFHGENKQLRVDAGVGDFGINQYAHGQIAVNAGIPKAYYDRMLASEPELLAGHINHWFRAEPKKHLVRTLDGSVRAVLSDRYRPLDNFELLTSIFPFMQEMRGDLQVVSSEVTERKMYLKFAVPSLRGTVPGVMKVGDEVMAGVVIGNSEVGDGSLYVDPFITILRCTNGMSIDKFGKRRNHVGRAQSSGDDATEFYQDDTQAAMDVAFFKQIRDTVKGVLEPAGFERILGHMREKAEAKIEAKPEDVVEVLANKYSFNQTTKEGIFRHLVEQGLGFTGWGLVNAVNRQAADEANYDENNRLEEISGKILTLNPSEWKVISTAQEPVPVRRRGKLAA